MPIEIRDESRYEIDKIIKRLQELRKGFMYITDASLLEVIHNMNDDDEEVEESEDLEG